MDQAAREQMREEAKKLLTEARYLEAEEIFMIETALSATEIDENELKEIHSALSEYKKEQDAAYADFKSDMSRALGDYAAALTQNKKSE